MSSQLSNDSPNPSGLNQKVLNHKESVRVENNANRCTSRIFYFNVEHINIHRLARAEPIP